jgi:hypothetical protein
MSSKMDKGTLPADPNPSSANKTPLKRAHSPEDQPVMVKKRLAANQQKVESMRNAQKPSDSPAVKTGEELSMTPKLIGDKVGLDSIKPASTNGHRVDKARVFPIIANEVKLSTKNGRINRFSTKQKPSPAKKTPARGNRFKKPEYLHQKISDVFKAKTPEPTGPEMSATKEEVAQVLDPLVFSSKTPCTIGNSLGKVSKQFCGRDGALVRVNGAEYSPSACVDHLDRLNELASDCASRISKVAPIVCKHPGILAETIGEGYVLNLIRSAFARVKVMKIKDGNPIVVKMIDIAQPSGSGVPDPSREVRILTRVNGGANVVLFLGAYTVITPEKFSLCIMSPLGIPLTKIINSYKTEIGVDHVLTIVQQTNLGLEYIHRKGVVHRDIKPDNLLVVEDGKVKINDFGISQYCKLDNGVIRGVDGSKTFMAPEIRIGNGYGTQVDLFSLGMTARCIFDKKTTLRVDQEGLPIVRRRLERDSKMLSVFTGLLKQDPTDRLTASGLRVILAGCEDVERGSIASFVRDACMAEKSGDDKELNYD